MEEYIFQSQENSSKEPQESLLELPYRNNAIPEWNNTGSYGNVLACCRISDISPEILQTDPPMERNLPPVQNQFRKLLNNHCNTKA